jgi:small ligand-binding sensory domain FIST
MEFFESLSEREETTEALTEILAELTGRFSSRPPDLGFLFFSRQHSEGIEAAVSRIREATGVTTLLGCTGESIIGGGREVERSASVSLWLGSLPGVKITSFDIDCERTPDGFSFPLTPETAFRDAGENACVLLLGEPLSMPVDVYLRRLNEDHPGLPVVGGMASGATGPDENLLLHNDRLRTCGAVGVVLSGDVKVRTVVSQGCRPVGKPLVVTACDRNSMQKLGGRPALACIQELFTSLTPEDRLLFQRAPHIGVVMNESQHAFGPGDFLIRNVIGVDPDKGTIFVGDYLRRGQTVQFHVRDGEAASLDLKTLLEKTAGNGLAGTAQAALMFCCNGRGTRLFDTPNHDIDTVLDQLGEIPVSGFFAQGELGPVGDRNHLHGFTTCVVIFGL